MKAPLLAPFVDVIGLVRRQKRTIEEVAQITGLSDETVRRYFSLLHEEGLIEANELQPRSPTGGRPSRIYSWAP